MLTPSRELYAERQSGRPCWLLALSLWALLTSAAVSEAAADNLYEARVPVAGSDAAARDQALGAALSEVLVRVSGNLKAPQHPALARVVLNAQRLVQSYTYEKVAPVAAPEPASEQTAATTSDKPVEAAVSTTPPPPAPPAPTLMLHASFDPPGVVRVLSAAGFGLWSEPRPQSVLWLVLESGTDQTFIGSDAPAPLSTLLQTAAKRRGLPILYPLLDLEDQQKLLFGDVIDGAADHIAAASERYQPDAVITGYLRETEPGQYEARWNVYLQDSVPHWQAKGTLEQVINAGIDGAADVLARQMQAAPGDKGALQLRVSGITDLDRFADVEHYLTGLPAVQQVHTVTLEATAVTYALDLNDTKQVLQDAIAQGALLEPEPDAPTGVMLRYRLTQ